MIQTKGNIDETETETQARRDKRKFEQRKCITIT